MMRKINEQDIQCIRIQHNKQVVNGSFYDSFHVLGYIICPCVINTGLRKVNK